jgi:hypothetical protein
VAFTSGRMVQNSLGGRLNPDDSMELAFPGLPIRALNLNAPKEEVLQKVEVKVNKVWVWRPKGVKSPWQRFFVVVEEGELKTYKDDKVNISDMDRTCMVLLGTISQGNAIEVAAMPLLRLLRLAEALHVGIFWRLQGECFMGSYSPDCCLQARCPLECVHLGGSSVKEVSTSSREEVRPHRAASSKSQNRHHNKAITIWVSAAKDFAMAQDSWWKYFLYKHSLDTGLLVFTLWQQVAFRERIFCTQ